MEYDYRKLDEAVSNLYYYFSLLAKDNHKITLTNFNFRNKSHMALFYVAAMNSRIEKNQLVVNCGLKDYLKTKWYFRDLIGIKWAKSAPGPMCAEMVNRIETIFYPHILEDVYGAYYERKRR